MDTADEPRSAATHHAKHPRRGGHTLTRRLLASVVVTAVALAWQPHPARGSADSKSSEASNSNSESSQDSSDASDTSRGTSQDSSAASERSSDSTRGTTQDSTESRNAKIVSAILVILVVGGAVAGGVLLSQRLSGAEEAVALRSLQRYLRRHHPVVTRDLLLAEGPTLVAWAGELGLTADEQQRLGAALQGSAEQTALLETLGSDLSPAAVQRFAALFYTVTLRALGSPRMDALVRRALGRS